VKVKCTSCDFEDDIEVAWIETTDRDYVMVWEDIRELSYYLCPICGAGVEPVFDPDSTA